MLNNWESFIYFGGSIYCVIRCIQLKYKQVKTGIPWEQLSSYKLYAYILGVIGFLLLGIDRIYTYNLPLTLGSIGLIFILLPIPLKMIEDIRLKKESKEKYKPFADLMFIITFALFIIAYSIFDLFFRGTPQEYLVGFIIPTAIALFIVVSLIKNLRKKREQ